MKQRYRVRPDEVLRLREAVRRNIPRSAVGRLVFAVVNGFTFLPMIALARVGLLFFTRTPPDRGSGPGSAGAGVVVPRVPPVLGGTAALRFPAAD